MTANDSKHPAASSFLPLVVSFLLACGGGNAQETGASKQPEGRKPAEAQKPAEPQPQGTPDSRIITATVWKDVTVPAGTRLELKLQTPLDSESSKVNTVFGAGLEQAIEVDGSAALPKGSIVEGIVKEATPAASGGASGGILSVGIRQVRTPAGTGAVLSARVAEAGPAAKPLARIAPGRTIAESGVLSAGAPSKPLSLPGGTRLAIVLDQPLTIKVKQN